MLIKRMAGMVREHFISGRGVKSILEVSSANSDLIISRFDGLSQTEQVYFRFVHLGGEDREERKVIERVWCGGHEYMCVGCIH